MSVNRIVAGCVGVAVVLLTLALAGRGLGADAMEGDSRGRDGSSRNGENGGRPEDEDVEIVDNSFLIEEAYNQPPGVVQHVFNWIPAWDRSLGLRHSQFDFVFTQEWPVFSQRHQFSYTLPMQYTADRTSSGELFQSQGFGDVLLNYRYQLLGGEGADLWIAPRFSVILRTGEVDSGPKTDRPGYQVNLPISKQFERWTVHGNAGWTSDAQAFQDIAPVPRIATLTGYNLGGSAIYLARPNFHWMLEMLALWEEEPQLGGRKDHTTQLQLSPGFRWAPYTEGDTQWVVGVGVPVGLTRDASDISLFLYMSFEHRFKKARSSNGGE